MGHRNSSAHIHDALGICGDGDGAARAAAGASSLKVAGAKVAAAKSASGASRIETSAAKAVLILKILVSRLKPRPPVGALKVATSKKVWTSRAAAWLLLTGIRFYQAVFAPAMPVGCKFYPSCSHYAAEAITRHGAGHGVWLAAARLWRCRPFTQGGFDPVPDVVEDMAEFLGSSVRGNEARSEVRT